MLRLRTLAADLETGRITARQLVESCLERIANPVGEGSRTFIAVFAEAARLTADWVDAMRRIGGAQPAFAGVPISVKASFDVGGVVTTCGSAVLADALPAAEDAEAVRRLRTAGFIVIGQTNMTEFAYSAVGSNAVYGTPACAWDRARRLIPGGSSSGAAVSVTDGMAAAALGSDSGGSCRIPAALNGLVGFKPTAARMPTDGANVMTPSLDSIGSLAVSVDCAAVLDAVLAGRPSAALMPRPLAGLRLAIPVPVATEALDAPIAAAFQAACDALSRHGVQIKEVASPEFSELPRINAKGGFSAPEYYVWHRDLIARHAARYEPRILSLILRGKSQSAADYLDLIRERRALTETVRARTAAYDALLLPTVPIVASPIADMDDDAAYSDANLRLLRNTRLANFLGSCAITLPCQPLGDMPVGLMLQAPTDADDTLLAIAAAVEASVSPAQDHHE
jgi:aspartyl-tRNA(Asn)/glutamyl-tRNA(Gln) amidotransferase subunit A